MKHTVFVQGVLSTNCTVLEKNGKCIVVDVAHKSFQLEEYVKNNGLQVQAVLLTHGHFDHCGGVQHFLNTCNCKNVPVFVHKNDLALCNNASKWLKLPLPQIFAEDCFPTHFVSEGQLDVGDFHFEVLETCGHTSGSVVYLTEGLMLSGDTLLCGKIGRTDFEESVPSEMPKSLRKLCALQENYSIIAGHGSTTTLQQEKQSNPHLLKLK